MALAAVALLTACTTTHSIPEREPGSAVPGEGTRCGDDLLEGLGAWARAGFSGSVVVSTGGEPDCLAAFGSADGAGDGAAGTANTVDTVFAIGSVSKAFTAAAVLGLVDAGELSLDDRAGNVITDLEGPPARATVEQLLLHTSGLTGSHGDDHEPLDRDAAVAAIGRLERAFPPGTDSLYSNSGYTLLALLVEEVTEAGYRDHMAAEVLPLPDGGTAGGFWDGEPAAPGPRAVGLLETGPAEQRGGFAGPHWALDGNGDLAMSAPDLAAWTHALFTGGVVPPEAVATITAPGFDHGDGTAEAPGWVSLDASVHGTPALASSGGGGDTGHEAVAVWVPQDERVVVAVSNSGGVRAGDLMREAGPALLAGGPPPPPGPGAAPDDFGDFDDADVAAHEQGVRTLLDGGSREGHEEREALESELGPLVSVEVLGTVVAEAELRTYVTASSATDSTTLWYALDERGGVAAVEGSVDAPPSLSPAPPAAPSADTAD
ncbi:CubicO group peptidase (beta-lactamase class C family) [Nocardiopsis sp. Huas11]|nr:CubicO group peptidase (beta-lactamase class C family) [Nocardiopsis sp. Huas11]